MSQHVDDGVKRHRPAERDRLGLDPRRGVAEPLSQLLQEPRLADPGLADDHAHLPLPGARLLEAVGEQAELAVAADEARAAELALGIAHEPVRGFGTRGIGDPRELEMPTERAGRARADDDTSRLGRRDERVEDRAGLAPSFALEHDVPVAGRYPQARSVDRDAHIGPERVVAPGARGRLADGDGRVDRAAGRILGRIEPEHHEGAAGADAFDPAAKTLRLVHDAFERPRHLGRVGLGARRDEGHSQ